MRKGQSGDLYLLIFTASFVSFLGFVVASGGVGVLTEGEVEGIGENPLDTDVCDIGGFDALVDAATCAIDTAGYFTNFLFIESKFAIVNQLLLIPISVGIIYIIVKIIRGN